MTLDHDLTRRDLKELDIEEVKEYRIVEVKEFVVNRGRSPLPRRSRTSSAFEIPPLELPSISLGQFSYPLDLGPLGNWFQDGDYFQDILDAGNR